MLKTDEHKLMIQEASMVIDNTMDLEIGRVFKKIEINDKGKEIWSPETEGDMIK